MRLGDLLAADLYGVLGVSEDAKSKEIRRAYRRLAMMSHPDLAQDDREVRERRMVELNVAASVLLDPGRRAAYDRARARAAAGRAATGSSWDFWWISTGFRRNEEWDRPDDAPVTRLEGELGDAVRSFRSWPARAVCEVARLTSRRSPATHAIVTVASVGLALMLISLARPRSLGPLFQQQNARASLSVSPTST
jgi:hypothetical protein